MRTICLLVSICRDHSWRLLCSVWRFISIYHSQQNSRIVLVTQQLRRWCTRPQVRKAFRRMHCCRQVAKLVLRWAPRCPSSGLNVSDHNAIVLIILTVIAWCGIR